MAEPAIVVGQVAKAHGVHGEVAVRNRSDNPDRWIAGATVYAPDGRELTVRAVRPHGDKLLVTFAQIDDRVAAEALHGAELTVPGSWLPELADGEWWPHDLEGCVVTTDDGRVVGTIREVEFNPANDLWVTVDDAGRETLVPALASILLDVDVAAKRILVRAVPGLTVPESGPA
ncbi:MAG TPA: ribosome maturation factor RimM [Actinomycetota bacterium]|nr:ribosome maturation factor RimM [Actinomycetota bacterium]